MHACMPVGFDTLLISASVLLVAFRIRRLILLTDVLAYKQLRTLFCILLNTDSNPDSRVWYFSPL